jgi:hypothetical protein
VRYYAICVESWVAKSLALPLPKCSTRPSIFFRTVRSAPSSEQALVRPQTNELQAELFCDNLRRYLDEEPLINELDKKLLS